MVGSELILGIINTIFSGLSVVFIIFGWIIPYRQSQKQQRDQRDYEESSQSTQYYKDRIDEQISKLYVPLYSLSMENKTQTNILLKKLNRNYVFAKGKTIDDLSENDRLLWIDFVKNHFAPNLNRMKDILNNNIHLIFEPELPSSYQRFMNYALKLNNDLELYEGHIYTDCGNLFVTENYPSDFDIYINKTLDKLLQAQRERLTQGHQEDAIVLQSDFDIKIDPVDFGETVILVDTDNPPFLQSLSDNSKIVISSSRFTIGRDKYCNYMLDNKTVSRQHLMIFKEDDQWYITAFNTQNGTYLNDELLAANAKTLLHENDIVRLANMRYRFHCL